MNMKMKILKLSDNSQNAEWSLTPTDKDGVFNVFNEAQDRDFGTHHRSRLLTLGWTNEQLDYVEENGTTNFVRDKRK